MTAGVFGLLVGRLVFAQRNFGSLQHQAKAHAEMPLGILNGAILSRCTV